MTHASQLSCHTSSMGGGQLKELVLRRRRMMAWVRVRPGSPASRLDRRVLRTDAQAGPRLCPSCATSTAAPPLVCTCGPERGFDPIGAERYVGCSCGCANRRLSPCAFPQRSHSSLLVCFSQVRDAAHRTDQKL